MPLAPDASSSTVSLVDMQPSESTRSKVVRVAARRAASSAGLSTSASVVRTTSMVARPGASMPAPLAIPPTVQPSPPATAVLCTVSVVLMAMAALAAVFAERGGGLLDAGEQLVHGEQKADEPGGGDGDLARAVALQHLCGLLGRGVGVLEALGSRTGVGATGVEDDGGDLAPLRTCSDQRTGAALTRLEVKTPAAARRGPLLTTRARSGLPLSLIPAAMPAAENPCAAVTLTVPLRSSKDLCPRGVRGRCSCSGGRRPRCPWRGCRWR